MSFMPTKQPSATNSCHISRAYSESLQQHAGCVAPATTNTNIYIMPYVLPLTEAQLKAIRASVPQAKDMPIRPLEKWSSLSSEEARHCFESGDLPWPAIEEEQPPPPPPPPCAVCDLALSQLCDSLSISAAESVRPCIGCRTFEDWLAFAEASSRPELLAELKRLGVGLLGARQGFANALGKITRERTATAAAMAPAPPPDPDADELATNFDLERALAVQVQGGLCNRLRVVLSYLYVARSQGRPLLVIWPPDDACPGTFADCFDAPENTLFVHARPAGVRDVAVPAPTADFHVDIKHTQAEVEMYKELLPNSALRHAVVRNVCALAPSFGAVHVRRTDAVLPPFDRVYRNNPLHATDEQFVAFLQSLPDVPLQGLQMELLETDLSGGVAHPAVEATTMRAYIATDNARTQDVFRKADGVRSRLAACPPIGGARMASSLRHTTVFAAAVDLLTCASADGPFKGSYQSSFSDTIGRLRRLHGRVHPMDDHVFADERVETNLRRYF